ncbi:MAG: hypothetical protein U0235_10815 [Polyangiaceae bacterium]
MLRARCPADHERQCWGVEDERFTSDDDAAAQVERDLARLEKRGLTVRAVRVWRSCARSA